MTRNRRIHLTILGACVVAVTLFPYAVMFLTALKSNQDLYSIPPQLVPTFWEWGNLISVWSETKVGVWLSNSILIAVSATLLTLFITVPGAYFLATNQFRGR